MQEEQLGQQLHQNWQIVHTQAGEAIQWIQSAKLGSNTIANEATELIHKLRQTRNQARKLGSIAQTGSTIGFFGLSQAGKSYLISALIAGTDGELETRLDGQLLNFIEHINPPGGGAEATGLVTRFCKRQALGQPGFPLQLELFTEVELVKVLVNAFMEDFNQQKIGFSFDGDQLEAAHQALKEARTRQQSEPSDAITPDDVVDLWDYLLDGYPSTFEPITRQFLPELVDLAPRLSRAERVKLFSFMWGRIAPLTECFEELTAALETLGSAKRVLAGLDALVEPNDSGQGFRQKSDSIMNVTTLFALGQTSDASITVRLPDADSQAIEVSRAVLAALTAEILFPLENTPAKAEFNAVDILDFPGYRGRMKLESFDELEARASDDSGNQNRVAELILRGKVAYLFQRYTDMQEMNVLVICAASDKQSDVADVGPVLNRWVHKTQGATPEARAKRQSGLVWAMTRFDLKLQSTLPNAPSMFNDVWNGVIKITLTEKFSGCEWLGQWSPQEPFQTSFLVRKPGMADAFIDTENGQELAVSADKAEKIQAMASTWAGNAAVQQHVADPDQAWQAMMTLNDGGISRLSHYLSQVAVRANKLARLNEQLNEAVDQLASGRLSDWYNPSGADELKVRTKRAQEITGELKKRAKLFGFLQRALMLSDEKVRALYLSSDYDLSTSDQQTETVADNANEAALDEDFGLDLDIDLFSEKPASAAASKPERSHVTASDARFAKAIHQAWINHLSVLPDNEALLRFTGIGRRIMEQLTAEIIIALTRFEIETKLIDKVCQTEQVGTKRESLVDRQVLSVQTLMGDFLTWLGQHEIEPAQRPKNPHHGDLPLFSPPDRVPNGALPPIAAKPVDYYSQYAVDWLLALGRLVMDNAGYDAGRDISPELNARLGQTLAQLKAAKLNSP